MIPAEWVEDAHQRINRYIIDTPISYDKKLDIYFKLENHQKTGSFKLRGALNKILSLQQWEVEKGIVTCSAGNHGQGAALASNLVNTKCMVFVPEHATPVKVSAMQNLGAEVVLVHGSYAESEKHAKNFAAENGKTFVSPYNDGQVIAGQGTVGLDVIRQLGNLEGINSIIVPAGGGGLIVGIGAAIQQLETRPKLIGVQSTASPFLHHLFYHGTQAGIVELDSAADGLAGEVDPESITIPLVNEYVDEILLVSEEDILRAISYAWHHYGEIIEGSAAVGLAARLTGKIEQLPALIVITGGNIEPSFHQKIIRDPQYQVA